MDTAKFQGNKNKFFVSGNQFSCRIDVNITELVLTPHTCASLINEIIKCLIYQKSQVPYPYNWLRNIVNRKRKKEESEVKSISSAAERYFRVVSTAYDTLEEIMRNINNELIDSDNIVEEVVILFGATPFCPKEAFIVKIPVLAKGHVEGNHIFASSRNQHKILRDIFLSQSWINAMDSTLPPTNMHILIHKYSKLSNSDSSNDAMFFVPSKHYSCSSKVKNTVINLQYSDVGKSLCCDTLSVYEDHTQSLSLHISTTSCEQFVEGNIEKKWYQGKLILKGFKDCVVNKISASELW